MPARRRLPVLAAVSLAAVLAVTAPPAAHGQQQVDRIARDFETGGTISPCRHGERDLLVAQQAALTDPGAFPEGFTGAVGAALAARGRGDCEPQGGAGATPTPTPSPPGETQAVPPVPGATTPTPTPGGAVTPQSTPGAAVTPQPTAAPSPAATTASEPAPAAVAAGGDAIPAAAWILGGAALALALLTLALALAARRRRGTDRLAAVGHAWREAGHRAGGAWLDFSDWLRTGR